MNPMRMVSLMVCLPLSQMGDVRRPFMNLMASAFTTTSSRRAFNSRPTTLMRFSSDDVSTHSYHFFAGSLATLPSYRMGDVYSSVPSMQSSSCVQTKLYSTTPANDLANSDDITLEVDPYSDEARDDLATFYEQNGILLDADIDAAHKNLLRLTEQVLSWNQRLNLVSRKDCTASVVYHRHILPSVALLPLILKNQSKSNQQLNIVDVGTGGGFPGLPLALLLPDVQFTLVDSIQKKLVAVSEMAAELDMTNVRIHCGRVEEMYEGDKGRREHRGRYDVVLGRSVTALPRFCGWVTDLLKKKSKNHDEGSAEPEGRLIYIIGGELDDVVESRINHDIPLDQLLLREEGTSDKRALIFSAQDVEEIATESGEKQKIVRSGPGKRNKNKNRQNKNKKMARGAWSKKQNDVKKQRGYDDFQRYEF